MNKLIITDYDASTGVTIHREMTNEELALYEQTVQETQSTEQVEPDAN